MLLLKFAARLVRLLNSETSASALALAVALGLFLGLVPLFTLQAAAVILVLMFFRVNLTAALFSFAVVALLRPAVAPALDRMGVSLLESASLAGLWTFLSNSPLALCGLANSLTLGATLAASVLLLPVFFGVRAGVAVYRNRLSERIAQLAVVNAVRSGKLYRLYERLTSPFGE